MNFLRKLIALIEHKQIDDEFINLEKLSDPEFQITRSNHLKRRSMPLNPINAGASLFLSLVGFPYCLLHGLIKNDSGWLFGSLFWLVIGILSYAYLAFSARYWREHYAIIHEEIRRYGGNSFG